MKITVFYEPPGSEVEVSVTVEDIIAALSEDPETVNQAINLAVRAHQALKAITADMISGMNTKVRDILCDSFKEQSARFFVCCAPPDNSIQHGTRNAEPGTEVES